MPSDDPEPTPQEAPTTNSTSPSYSAYAIVVIVFVVYYVIALLAVKKLGPLAFIPAWSLPVALLAVFMLSPSEDEHCKGTYLYVLTTAVLLCVVAIAAIALRYYPTCDRKVIFVGAMLVWVILSAVAVAIYYKSCHVSGEKSG